MAQSSDGAGENMAAHLVGEIIKNGVTLHLYGQGETASYSDGATEVSNKSDAQADIAAADMTVATPTDFSGTTTITVNVDVAFGPTDIGIIDDAVIQDQTNTDRWVSGNVPDNPDTTGEDVTLPSGTVVYEFGNPT